MAVIYLRHPVHGQKVACGEIEAEMDRVNGWEDFDPTAPAVPSFLAPVGGGVESDLPADFPGRKELIEGGLTTWASVVGKTVEDLQAVKGIGAVTASRIVEAMDS